MRLKMPAIVGWDEVNSWLAVSRFGQRMQLLHEGGVTGLDQWYSDFIETDWRYVERYYEEDCIPPWNECVVHGCDLIAPLEIPPLVHRQITVRFAF